MSTFPFYRQLDLMDCGPTCLRMIAKHYGRSFRLQTLRNATGINAVGVSLFGIAHAAEQIGFKTLGVNITIENLYEVPLPLIIPWNNTHFVIIYKVTSNKIFIADPGSGKLKYTYDELSRSWKSIFEDNGKLRPALLLEPGQQFFLEEGETQSTVGFSKVIYYFSLYKKLLLQLVFGIIVSSAIQLIFPFLTQSIVDRGINTKKINFILLILFAQIVLVAARSATEFIRSWILLYISSRINVQLISDFLQKLMDLPLAFFEIKGFGDIIRRIEDHSRIEIFLTSDSLNLFFSFFNIIAFGIVLGYYNFLILAIYFFLTAAYLAWVLIFLKQRKINDYKKFDVSVQESNALLQTIHGMQEIKLANAEIFSRWRWERIQARLFKISSGSLKLEQYQQSGGIFINETKNAIITFLSAQAVINGDISLGAMLAIQQIVGQLTGPTEHLVGFVQKYQDAKISLERVNEIHQLESEKLGELAVPSQLEDQGLNLKDLSFSYNVVDEPVLRNISLAIPQGKMTAVVGMSGSGKTTLLKLLLKFYESYTGEIQIGHLNLRDINQKQWRDACGVVTQDGFIFSDTVAANIAVGKEVIDYDRLNHSLRVANLEDFIKSLPKGHQTKIGSEGNGLSQGQKQRILIARAVYKNPQYILFDEATNALDAENEKIIHTNLNSFFVGRTVVIVAHRLSTVRNADQIIVMEKGRIVESGSHQELIGARGRYFKLIENQLEVSA